tara:strand:+ start:5027 stop:5566 length:540 start_codon:yes stop_codon:yes gene_type:complete
MKRNKNYILFIMGYWDRDTEIISEVIEVLSPITEEFSDIRYVHSESSLVCLFRSKEDFQMIDNYFREEFAELVDMYIFQPRSRKFGIRMDGDLEKHLMGNSKYQDLADIILEDIEMLGDINDIIGKTLSDSETNHEDKRTKIHDKKLLTLNGVLEKVYDTGIGSLTDEEKKFLDEESKK